MEWGLIKHVTEDACVVWRAFSGKHIHREYCTLKQTIKKNSSRCSTFAWTIYCTCGTLHSLCVWSSVMWQVCKSFLKKKMSMQYFLAVQLKTISLTKQKTPCTHGNKRNLLITWNDWLVMECVTKKSRIGMKQYFLIYH